MKTLNWQDLRLIGKSDSCNRWLPFDDIAEYFKYLRVPSRAWPHSYARSAQTPKFSKWLLENRPLIAENLGIIAD